MKHIPSFEEFLNESSQNLRRIEFVSHKEKHKNRPGTFNVGDSESDVVVGYVNKTMITYVINVKGEEIGKELMGLLEPGKDSKLYPISKIPPQYKNEWNLLKDLYQNKYKLK